MRLSKILLGIFPMLLVSYAWALDYPAALPNHHLKEELEGQGDRLIPKYDWFSASVDGQVYFRNLKAYDFYHGAGYWIQARTELQPSEMFTLNVRSIFYAGSISGGYTNPTGQYNLFGFTLKLPTPIFGGLVEARAIDIERQTIGEGIFIEEREMAGVWATWTRDDNTLKIMKEGTGGLVFGDDLNNVDLKLMNGLIGGGIIYWDASSQSDMTYNRKPFYYLNSTHPITDNIAYSLEGGYRNSTYAYLAAIKAQGTSGRLKYKSRLQYRHYGNNVAEDIKGQIDNMYISYDQYDKRYTASGNIFATDDNVNVYSLILNLEYELNSQWVLQSQNEVGKFDYKSSLDQDFYFYRAGVTYFLMQDREESFTLFMSNKVLTDSFMRPPADYSLNKIQPLFHERPFLGMEASFRF